MKNFFLTLSLYLISQLTASAQLITTWKTDNAGTSQSDQIQIPIRRTGYNIDWWLKSDSKNVHGSTAASGNNYILTLPQV
jgi:hypothetical protein